MESIFAIGSTLGALKSGALAAVFAVGGKSMRKPAPLPTHNPKLPFIAGKPLGWEGNPLKDNRYHNPDYPFGLSFKDVRKWKKAGSPYAKFKKTDTMRLPVVNQEDLAWITQDSCDGIAYLGHATFFIRVGGYSILTDPVFGNASYVVKRFADFPLDPNHLLNLDLLLVTHDHRDHMDQQSLKLVGKNNPKMQVVTGLKNGNLIHGFTKIGHEQIIEMGWYQQWELEGGRVRITYLPTRHWCRRWITDTNKRLWGAFVIEIDGKVIYFGGDSGYGKHYTEVAKLFPRIDYAILGIGAYQPEWFMEHNHSSPAKALQSALDMVATTMIPMHYGVFDLSDEPVCEPIERLEKDFSQVTGNAVNGTANVGEDATTAGLATDESGNQATVVKRSLRVIIPQLGENLLKAHRVL